MLVNVEGHGTPCPCPWQLTGAGRVGPETSHWLSPPPPGRRLTPLKEEAGPVDKKICLLSTGVQSAIRGLELASLLKWSAASCGNQEPSGARFGDVGGPVTPAPSAIGSKPCSRWHHQGALKDTGLPEGSGSVYDRMQRTACRGHPGPAVGAGLSALLLPSLNS